MQTYTNSSSGGLLGSKAHTMPTYDSLDAGYQNGLLGQNGSGYFYAGASGNSGSPIGDLSCKSSNGQLSSSGSSTSAQANSSSSKFWPNMQSGLTNGASSLPMTALAGGLNNGLNNGLTNGLTNGLNNGLMNGTLGSSFDSGTSASGALSAAADLSAAWNAANGLSPSTGSATTTSALLSSNNTMPVNSSSVINSQAGQSVVAGLANASSAWSAACCNSSNAFYPWMAIAGKFLKMH